jgi:hypothetical protein
MTPTCGRCTRAWMSQPVRHEPGQNCPTEEWMRNMASKKTPGANANRHLEDARKALDDVARALHEAEPVLTDLEERAAREAARTQVARPRFGA